MHTTKKIIDRFLNQADEKSMNDLINHSINCDLDDNEIVYLATGLAKSGIQIKLEQLHVCDVPSTGGPSSLSTLICPLFLKIWGYTVLKLGVPGRPAGGIDVLAQIKGFNINPDLEQLKGWVRKSKYVHFLANKFFTPLDAILFNYRKETNNLNIPSLVIASLLSKKIAVGLTSVALDIRVSNFGNFGRTFSDAEKNGIRFNRVAKLAGIKSTFILTDGNNPRQPYIGRGESILALNEIFTGSMSTHLKTHLLECFNIAESISNIKHDFNNEISLLEDAFFDNINIQGGQRDSFFEIAKTVRENNIHEIHATIDGYLSINIEMLRNSIVSIQLKSHDLFSDPCGIILKKTFNDYLSKGDTICSFRCIEKYKNEFELKLKNSFTISYRR